MRKNGGDGNVEQNKPLTEAEARQINPVVLAFVGDAVYSLYVRQRLVRSGAGKAADFQRAASKIVSAEGQSVFLEELEPLFTQTEAEIYRRGRNAKKALQVYLEQARENLKKGMETENLFVNCNGSAMSRQGFWKIIKYYGAKAGIQTDITPHTLRHSFAAHLIGGGADLHAVQTMMGHSDMTTTQAYMAYAQKLDPVRDAYQAAHPRR